jgi:hypothetical protein
MTVPSNPFCSPFPLLQIQQPRDTRDASSLDKSGPFTNCVVAGCNVFRVQKGRRCRIESSDEQEEEEEDELRGKNE